MDDFGNDLSTAFPINGSGRLSGSIDSGDDVDVFEFDKGVTATVQLEGDVSFAAAEFVVKLGGEPGRFPHVPSYLPAEVFWESEKGRPIVAAAVW